MGAPIAHYGGETTAGSSPHANLETRAHRDAMHSIAQGVPDPATYARRLPLHMVEMLMLSQHIRGGIYRAHPDFVPDLQAEGLVEAGETGRFLTAFGLKVLRELKKDDA
jgi:hypothetical protein